MHIRAVAAAGSFVAGIVWVGLLTLLLPAGGEGLAADLLLDRNTRSFPYPFTGAGGDAGGGPSGLKPPEEDALDPSRGLMRDSRTEEVIEKEPSPHPRQRGRQR